MEERTDIMTETIGQIVASDYRKAEVFKKFGLDFCCGGGKSIELTCLEKNIDSVELLEALEAVGKNPRGNSINFNEQDLDILISHIISTHHHYINENIPLIKEFAKKVARVHGESHPQVIDIANTFVALADELSMHMHKEEFILFPYINQLVHAERSGASLSAPPFGTIANPINMMENDHENAGNALGEMKMMSNNYTPPEYACNTFRVLFAKLEEFEDDLHRHIHLENNILFPRAIRLETKLMTI